MQKSTQHTINTDTLALTQSHSHIQIKLLTHSLTHPVVIQLVNNKKSVLEVQQNYNLNKKQCKTTYCQTATPLGLGPPLSEFPLPQTSCISEL